MNENTTINGAMIPHPSVFQRPADHVIKPELHVTVATLGCFALIANDRTTREFINFNIPPAPIAVAVDFDPANPDQCEVFSANGGTRSEQSTSLQHFGTGILLARVFPDGTRKTELLHPKEFIREAWRAASLATTHQTVYLRDANGLLALGYYTPLKVWTIITGPRNIVPTQFHPALPAARAQIGGAQ